MWLSLQQIQMWWSGDLCISSCLSWRDYSWSLLLSTYPDRLFSRLAAPVFYHFHSGYSFSLLSMLEPLFPGPMSTFWFTPFFVWVKFSLQISKKDCTSSLFLSCDSNSSFPGKHCRVSEAPGELCCGSASSAWQHTWMKNLKCLGWRDPLLPSHLSNSNFPLWFFYPTSWTEPGCIIHLLRWSMWFDCSLHHTTLPSYTHTHQIHTEQAPWKAIQQLDQR